jgi:hypothetical protein
MFGLCATMGASWVEERGHSSAAEAYRNLKILILFGKTLSGLFCFWQSTFRTGSQSPLGKARGNNYSLPKPSKESCHATQSHLLALVRSRPLNRKHIERFDLAGHATIVK